MRVVMYVCASSIGCLVSVEYLDAAMIQIGVPTVLILLASVGFVVFHRRGDEGKAGTCIQFIVIFTFLVFVSTSNQIFSILNCKRFADGRSPALQLTHDAATTYTPHAAVQHACMPQGRCHASLTHARRWNGVCVCITRCCAGNLRLVADLDVVCFEGVHMSHSIAAVFFIALYPVGVPVGLLVALTRQRVRGPLVVRRGGWILT